MPPPVDRVGSPSVRPPFGQPGGGPPIPLGGRPPIPPNLQPNRQSPVASPQMSMQGVSPAGINNNALPSPVTSQPDPEAPPLSPSVSTDISAGQDTHRRKRMYPDQITKAYQGDVALGQGQFITPGGGPGMVPLPAAPNHFAGAGGMPPSAVQPQFFVPGETSGGFAQGYSGPGAQQMANPGAGGYANYPAPNVAGVANQFGSMNLGGAPQNSLVQVSLIGTPPNIVDIDAPPPPIRLPPNTSVTQSLTANCDPRYTRCTVNAFPATDALAKRSRIPLALVITPYPTVKDGEEPVPTVSDTVVARCRRCRSYINPFVTFVEGGQRWKCNLCFLLNNVPSAFDYDVQTQQPVDRWKRAELNHACLEFVAPTEYMVRPPQPPVYIFVIDVSYPAVQSGMVATAARTILDSLDRLPNEESRTKVGLITVDGSLHFYNLNAGLTDPQMLVVSDTDEVFLPQPDDLLVNLTESRAVFESLLARLGDMFKDNTNVSNALGPALQAAFKLITPIGGKIIVCQSSLPNIGVGQLKLREDVKLLGTPKESTLLITASPFYKTFAVDCSRSQVSVDMFLFGSQYSDFATLSCIPRYTSGQTYFYPAFNAARIEDAFKFAHEFSEHLAQQIALEALMRVRASKGLRMTSFHGNFFVRSTDLLAMPAVPRDQGYVIEVGIEENINSNVVCLQTAVLHTTCYGERRIRVLTLCLPVTSSLADMYASADQVAITALLANKTVERSLVSRLEDGRDALTNKVVDILGVYKTALTGSGVGNTPQLFAPDNLKLLPLLALGLLKHVGLRQSSQIPTDLRSNAMNLLKTMPAELLIPYIHPHFHSLHNMPQEVGTVGPDGLIMPPCMNLSSEKLERHGCYLLEDGQNMFIWVGREVVPQLCVDLFDVPSYEGLHGGKITLPTLDNPFSQRVNLIVGKVREMRRGPYYPHLYLVKEDGEPALRLWFLSHLIEDRTDTVMSYYQWLGHLKDKVNSSTF
ncbi:hypothetical protein BC937DRAFT_88161 [Endogone sp. FLAS-F59071]|nr:hypothetical protein BC937DRAFT_88161 [Endogone sp. FLAS-F59071]|eukprot:RUS18929.1 hypothetical protein BC937DRAFT_88161 [Endogone sp. FLAS-F59071]